MTSETQTFGRIATIEITSHGSGYEAIPTVTIENEFSCGTVAMAED